MLVDDLKGPDLDHASRCLALEKTGDGDALAISALGGNGMGRRPNDPVFGGPEHYFVFGPRDCGGRPQTLIEARC